MRRQATLFQSWGSGTQKQGSRQTGSVRGDGLKQSGDGLGTDELDDEDLLLAMAMEESLKDLQQPGLLMVYLQLLYCRNLLELLFFAVMPDSNLCVCLIFR